MTLSICVPIVEAEKWKQYLMQHELMNQEYRPVKDRKFMYFPILKKFKAEVTFVEKKFERRIAHGGLKDNLFDKLSSKEQKFLQTAHDVIGTIAILEIPEELVKKEKMIAQTLLKTNSNIKTVLKKAASHEGTFRTQKMKYLAGVKTKEATYKENGTVMKLDVEKVYFSVRLSNERLRISRQVKKGEEILVMFSGCAPYCVVFAKNTGCKKIIGIEINPEGHKYGLENIKLNKLSNVGLINGDVHEVIPPLKKENPKLSFDRIVMPLPKTADEFLQDALMVSRKGTIIHFYDFLAEDKFDEAIQKIATACKNAKMKYKILEIVKCGQHAPHVYRICVDFQIV